MPYLSYAYSMLPQTRFATARSRRWKMTKAEDSMLAAKQARMRYLLIPYDPAQAKIVGQARMIEAAARWAARLMKLSLKVVEHESD